MVLIFRNFLILYGIVFQWDFKRWRVNAGILRSERLSELYLGFGGLARRETCILGVITIVKGLQFVKEISASRLRAR